jgi:hypothetical protein
MLGERAYKKRAMTAVVRSKRRRAAAKRTIPPSRPRSRTGRRKRMRCCSEKRA